MFRKKHILVVEDGILSRKLTRTILESSGFEKITEVDDHKDALSVLRSYKVDLLVLEHEINGVYSQDYVRQIRDGQAGKKKNIPIILLTHPNGDCWLEEYLTMEAKSIGATACVARPLCAETLLPPILDALAADSAKSGKGGEYASPSFGSRIRDRFPCLGPLTGLN